MSALRTDLRLLNRGHSTRWGNLGDWSAASSYPDACAALARRLGQAAQLGPSDRLLDCGVGAGEQLALWAREFGIRDGLGLDVLGDNVRAAQAQVQAAGLGSLRVERGSATQLGARGPFDAILALDCAYHFRPRSRFFREAARCAAPGARLALTDVVVRPRAPRPLKALARWLAVPPRNLLTRDGYEAELRAAGWTLSAWTDLDAQVLEGFGRFALGRMSRRALRHPLSGWPKVLATGLGCRWAYRHEWVHYALIVAERP